MVGVRRKIRQHISRDSHQRHDLAEDRYPYSVPVQMGAWPHPPCHPSALKISAVSILKLLNLICLYKVRVEGGGPGVMQPFPLPSLRSQTFTRFPSLYRLRYQSN